MIGLDIVYSNGKKEYKEFEKEAVLGRLKTGIDVSILENKISRKHSKIFFRNGKWFIKDLASTNKTYLNGSYLESFVDTPLINKDCITIGNTTITVKLKEERDFKEDISEGDDETFLPNNSDETLFPSNKDKGEGLKKFYLECLNGVNKGNSIFLDFSESNQLDLAKSIGIEEIDGEVLLNFDNTYFIVVNLSDIEVKINFEVIVQNHVFLDGNIIEIGDLKFRFVEELVGFIVDSNKLELSLEPIIKQTDNKSKNKIFILIIIILSALIVGYFIINFLTPTSTPYSKSLKSIEEKKAKTESLDYKLSSNKNN